jgi:ABC-2 type transport system ATP-binding protein
VLISSHLLAEIEQVATHVAIMSTGHLLQQGPLAEVLAGTARRVTITTTATEAAAFALSDLGLADVVADPVAGTVSGLLGDRPAQDVAPALVGARVPFTGLRTARPGLEDFFVGLTGEGFDVAG